jgi:hypothetical protein
MSFNNANNAQLVLISLGSIAANGSIAGLKLPKKSFIKSATLIDAAGIAASDSNYVQVSLQNGDDVIAELDSRAAHENGLTALEGKAMNMVAAKQEQAAGANLKVVYAETGTVTLTNAQLQLEIVQY